MSTQDVTGHSSEPAAEVTATPVPDLAKASIRVKTGQQEMPFALVQGQPMTQLPLDLYIPPDALEVILEQFEGPLDLLLYLIRKQNLDILEVNVSEIVDQYIEYIDMMQAMQLELAGEYLVMAAMLAEIKSRVLLPRNREDGSDEEEDDPRAELLRRLQEYERFKTAAENLDELPRLERDIFLPEVDAPDRIQERVHPEVEMRELMLAFAAVLRRAERFEHHEIQREQLSTRERMSDVLARLQSGHFMSFRALFDPSEGKLGVVVTFLAILELVKESLIDIVQQDTFGPIHLRAREHSAAGAPSYQQDGEPQ
ncbi:segregation/condensation protein A [Thalassolituus sp. ST750PaO-4]|jgi:segregation and condensation protein A|uniref:segregation and condensation protein A n=1 Tax=Thalassolituus sp. ST750PaO-4 TaxID=2742965 RepID=UPI002386DA52|nr:segregation/condensation protein A [Gammaproteobacteria bacterium]MCA6058365.1 segregation/condensation protein A [Thalassolituus sp. ST750PaO-4]